jgi:hypothetical protein
MENCDPTINQLTIHFGVSPNSQSMRNMMKIYGVWGHHILRQSQVELLYTKCFHFFYEHINS